MICQACGKEVEPGQIHTYDDCKVYINKVIACHILEQNKKVKT